MRYKKYLLVALVLLMLFHPGYFFGTLGIILLVVVIILFVLDLVLDIYLFASYLKQWFRDRR